MPTRNRVGTPYDIEMRLENGLEKGRKDLRGRVDWHTSQEEEPCLNIGAAGKGVMPALVVRCDLAARRCRRRCSLPSFVLGSPLIRCSACKFDNPHGRFLEYRVANPK